MAYAVAPKVQGTNMAPRQNAMNRALNKTVNPQPATQSSNGPLKPPKPRDLQTGTQFGGAGRGAKGPKYELQENTPGLNVNNQPTTNPPVPQLGPNGHIKNPGNSPIGPVTPVAGGGQDPMGTGDPELDKYLAGDETYQSILASIQRNKDNSKITYDYNVNNLNTDNDTIKRRLAAKEVEDNKLLDSDYAARGLFGSGLFAKADTDLGQSYAEQNTDLATSLARNLQQLLTDQTSQDTLDDTTRRQAQLDAITRRAQEFGIFGGPNNSTDTGKDKDKKGGKKGKKGKK